MCCMQGINASVEVINTVKCDVDLDKIINIKGFQLEKVLKLDPNFLDVCASLCARNHLLPDGKSVHCMWIGDL